MQTLQNTDVRRKVQEVRWGKDGKWGEGGRKVTDGKKVTLKTGWRAGGGHAVFTIGFAVVAGGGSDMVTSVCWTFTIK
jgi:hypothetical protein